MSPDNPGGRAKYKKRTNPPSEAPESSEDEEIPVIKLEADDVQAPAKISNPSTS